MAHKCLHCELRNAPDGWLAENKAGAGLVVGQTSRFLCDVIEGSSEPGQDRINLANSSAMAIGTMMMERMNRPRDEEPPAGASKH